MFKDLDLYLNYYYFELSFVLIRIELLFLVKQPAFSALLRGCVTLKPL
jgi:hypothetical protein